MIMGAVQYCEHGDVHTLLTRQGAAYPLECGFLIFLNGMQPAWTESNKIFHDAPDLLYTHHVGYLGISMHKHVV